MSLAPGRRPNRNNAQDRETVGYGNWLSECYRRLFSVAGGRVLSMLCGGLEFGSKASKQAMVSIQQAGRQAVCRASVDPRWRWFESSFRDNELRSVSECHRPNLVPIGIVQPTHATAAGEK